MQWQQRRRGSRSRLRDGGEHWPRVNELFADHVQPKIQTLERAHPEQNEIILFPKHHIISGSSAAGVDDRVADVTLDTSAVRDAKGLPALGLDAEGFKHGTRNPR